MYKEAISAYNTAIKVGEVRGREQGIEVGRENALTNTVKLLKEMGLNKKEVINKINNLKQYNNKLIEDITDKVFNNI